MDRNLKLEKAIREQDIDRVRRLVEKGVDVQYRNDQSLTFLHQAACYGNVEIVTLFIKLGVPIDSRSIYDFTPLHLAKSGAIASALILAKANIEATNGSKSKKQWKSLGNTPLHTAVWYDRIDVIEALLDAGADIDAKNKYGIAALHEAAGFGKSETVQALVDFGASIDILDNEGRTPLKHAFSQGQKENMEVLLQLGAKMCE